VRADCIGTIIYRVIQTSRTLAGGYPNATIFLVTEDGNRWKLPPPVLDRSLVCASSDARNNKCL